MPVSNDYNKCTFTGRLGADPESRAMNNGETVASFSLACGKQWKDRETGEKKELTEWVRCVAFGKLAGVITQYLKKGGHILVEGEMRTRKYTDKNGVERWSTEIVVQEMKMLGGKPEGAAAAKPASGPTAAARNPAQDQKRDPAPSEQFDDDIPF